MIKDNLYQGQQVRDKLVSGIQKVALAVGGTMGTGGSNAIIECIEAPGQMVTNDGFTIASNIRLADTIENMGRNILLESINRANKASGDGSSTTCVLTSAIIQEGLKYVAEVSPMEIKKSLEDCIPLIEESINKQKREITVDEVGKVASISAEDEQIGNTIQEIYKIIGKDGIIHWDISKTSEDTYTIGQGITVEGAGYLSPYMCDADEKTGQNTNIARINDAHVLLIRTKITSAGDFNDLFQSLFQKDIKDIVVFCDEIDPLVIPDLVKTRMVRGFRTVVVKMPLLWKDFWYSDLAKATGATIVDAVAGLSLKSANLTHLGKVEHIIVTKEDTYLDGIDDVSEYVKSLEEEGSDDSKLRASRLNTKTARYYVGAHSDSALSYRRLKVEDAISASWQALNGGIVAGGGVALMNIGLSFTDKDTIGTKILSQALASPFWQICCLNLGLKIDTKGWSDTEGINTITKQKVDMFDAGIVDPANIVFNSAKNAISVAASILTANVIVTLPREEQVQLAQPPVMI